jgi:hypothetical protein
MISLELRDQIFQYIYEDITLEQLEDWVVPRLPDFLKFYDSTDADIISAIELGLAELNNHNWTEEKFRTYLNEALQELIVMVQFTAEPNILTTSGSSNKTSDFNYSNASFEYSMTMN